MLVNEEECRAAGVDSKRVASMARRLDRICSEAAHMGLVIFGGSGSGSLRFDDQSGKGRLVVAEISGSAFDGGDGGCAEDESGLMRGE